MNEKRNKRRGTSWCPFSFMRLSIPRAFSLPTFYLRLGRLRSGYFLGVGSLTW